MPKKQRQPVAPEPARIPNKDQQSDEEVLSYALQSEDSIERRIDQVTREWSAERMLVTILAAVSFFGLTKGVFGKKRWFLAPAVALPFLIQQGARGFQTPLAVRRLRLRSQKEI